MSGLDDVLAVLRDLFADRPRRVAATNQESSMVLDRLDRFGACLLAGACGDALGAPIEFMRLVEIYAAFGTKGIRDFAPAYGRVGAITDDTQMTLFTAEGILDAFAAQEAPSDAQILAATHRSTWRWRDTQRGETALSYAAPDAGLIALDALHVRRSPGMTCLSSLDVEGSPGAFAQNNSKGCGGVMRMAPFGLAFSGDPARAFRLARDAAHQTHGHPSGYLAAGALAMIVAQIAGGGGLPDAIALAADHLKGEADHAETRDAILHAEAIASTSREPHASLGWVAEEALAIALAAVLETTSLDAAIIRAVNHGGDSDSTGAIAGGIAGVLYGSAAIPGRWLDQLELAEVIADVAHRLATAGAGA